MYILTFDKNHSKYFKEALSFAKELGGVFNGKTVIIKIKEHNLFIAYSTFRTLFGIVQNWKSTQATFRGEKVHPYQFILNMHRLGICQFDKDCGNSWGCKKLNNISYQENGWGKYESNNRFWYNYGYFKGETWVIDKAKIREKLLNKSDRMGLDICPLYDEMKIIHSIENLPDAIKPDDITFKYHFVERYVNGHKVLIKNNIRHITKYNKPFVGCGIVIK